MNRHTPAQRQRRRDLADRAAGLPTRHDLPPTGTTARLLPWTGADGEPQYLPTDHTGPLWALADQAEDAQLTAARAALRTAETAPGDLSEAELRGLIAELREGLADALRVADSRGARLRGGDRPEPQAEPER